MIWLGKSTGSPGETRQIFKLYSKYSQTYEAIFETKVKVEIPNPNPNNNSTSCFCAPKTDTHINIHLGHKHEGRVRQGRLHVVILWDSDHTSTASTTFRQWLPYTHAGIVLRAIDIVAISTTGRMANLSAFRSHDGWVASHQEVIQGHS